MTTNETCGYCGGYLVDGYCPADPRPQFEDDDAADDVEVIITGYVLALPADGDVEARTVAISRTENLLGDGEHTTRCHFHGGFVDTGQGQTFRVLNFWA